MTPAPADRTRIAAALTHVSVAVFFAFMALVWSYPLARHLETHLPGATLGDNTLFLWAFWWMRTALAAGTTFFHTAWLFAPAGVDLTLHSHAALPAFVGATVLGSVPLVPALNLAIIGSLALNALSAYALAWRLTRQHGASVVAGMIFGGSPYIAAHLNGHFNLTTAWTIPLFALTFIEASRGSVVWGVAAGLVLGATAYVDYYYLVFEVAFALTVLALTRRRWSIVLSGGTPSSAWSRLILAAIGADVALIALVTTTGGFGGPDWPFGLSVRETFNPRQALWVLIIAWLWIRYRPQVSVAAPAGGAARRTALPIAAVLGAFVVAAPILSRGVSVMLDGQYVSQPFFWRSAPEGIDLATLVLGPPFHGLAGGLVRDLYDLFGIDAIESSAWLGIMPLLLAGYACRRHATDASVRLWATIGGVFFVWAVGSHAFLFGQNTALIMPGTLVRLIPVLSNARMPGRAMALVFLALAMLAAFAVARYSATGRHPAIATACAAGAVFLEFLPAPFPIVAVDCPPIYRTLVSRPERGAVAELPLGIGDGLGAVTPVDHRTLVCQTLHERPIVGGFVARLPPAVLAQFQADPLLAAWLRLSGARAGVADAAPLPDAALARERLVKDGIAFVMLNRATASAELRAYVEQVLPLVPIDQDSERTLYTLPPQIP